MYQQKIVTRPEKGKPSERAGRRVAGLNPWNKDMAAGQPGEYSTSLDCISLRKTAQQYRRYTVKRIIVSISVMNQPLIRSCMVMLLALFVALTLSHQTADAAQANLSWQAPTTYMDGTPLTGPSSYKVYLGSASGNYSQTIDVASTTSYTLSNLNDSSTYFLATSAYDATGNTSGLSAEVTFTTPAPPSSLPLYTLTASTGSGGSISPSGSVIVSQGINQTFTITPNSGYKIASVTVDNRSVATASTFTFSNVTANHTISATFTANVASYSISATAGTGGSISPAGTTAVTSGGSKAFSITPAAGYKTAAVTVDGVSVGAVTSYTFSNVTANHTISATFSAISYANIPRTGWKLKYVDSQETVGQNGAATNAFDGQNGTMWHTQWKNSTPACPHEIQINLGKSYTINSLSYLPRQDGGINGTIAKYEFYVSSDGVNWGTAVATGTFAKNTLLKKVSFAAKNGQYIRLRALSEVNGKAWTSAAEINVTGY